MVNVEDGIAKKFPLVLFDIVRAIRAVKEPKSVALSYNTVQLLRRELRDPRFVDPEVRRKNAIDLDGGTMFGLPVFLTGERGPAFEVRA